MFSESIDLIKVGIVVVLSWQLNDDVGTKITKRVVVNPELRIHAGKNDCKSESRTLNGSGKPIASIAFIM